MTCYVNGVQIFQRISREGSCHEAAYRASLIAIRLAQVLGLTTVVITNSSRVVVNQFNGLWRARNPMMRLLRNQCRRLSRGMSVSFHI